MWLVSRAECAGSPPSPSWPRSSDVRTSSSGFLASRSLSDCTSSLVGSSSAQARTRHCLSLFCWGPKGALPSFGQRKTAFFVITPDQGSTHCSAACMPFDALPGVSTGIADDVGATGARPNGTGCLDIPIGPPPRRARRHRRHPESRAVPRHGEVRPSCREGPMWFLGRMPDSEAHPRAAELARCGWVSIEEPASEFAWGSSPAHRRRAGEGEPSFPARPAPASTCSPATGRRPTDGGIGKKEGRVASTRPHPTEGNATVLTARDLDVILASHFVISRANQHFPHPHAIRGHPGPSGTWSPG